MQKDRAVTDFDLEGHIDKRPSWAAVAWLPSFRIYERLSRPGNPEFRQFLAGVPTATTGHVFEIQSLFSAQSW